MDSARHADDLQGLGRPNGVRPVPRRPEGFLRRPTAPSSAGFQQEATQNPQNPVANEEGFHTLQDDQESAGGDH